MKQVNKAVGFFLKDPMNPTLLAVTVALFMVNMSLTRDFMQAVVVLAVVIGIIVVVGVMVVVSEWLAKIGRKMWEDNK